MATMPSPHFSRCAEKIVRSLCQPSPHFGGAPQPHAQRTLVSRFDMNKTQSIEVVRKLDLNVMGLLAKLGTAISRNVSGAGNPNTQQLGIMATQRPATSNTTWELGVLLYNSADGLNLTGATEVELTLQHVPAAMASVNTIWTAYLLDNIHGSAAAVWNSYGQPVYPSPTQWQAMRDAMEVPVASGFPRPFSSSLTVTVPLPGIVFLHACAQPTGAPLPVATVKLHVTTSYTPPEVLVSWQGSSDRCIRTYEVGYSTSAAGSATRVNRVDTIFRAFLHAQPGATRASGCYSVRAVDYWGRAGPASPTLCL